MRASTPAFILRRVRWSDSSLILTMYSLDFGRISVMARGALRPGGRFLGRLELFEQSEVGLSRREGRELDTLTDASVIAHNTALRTSHEAFSAAALFTEWLLAVVSHGNEPSAPVYYLTGKVFSLLCSGARPWPVICGGVTKLLSLAGLGFSVETCASCGGPSGKDPGWSHSRGGVICQRCGMGEEPLSPGALSFLTGAVSRDLEAISRVGLWKGGYIQCHSLLKDYAAVHLERRVKLKSEKVMKEILNGCQ